MGYINKVKIGNDAHLIEPTIYGVTNGTAAAITTSITGFEAIEGVVIGLKITTPNSASATLNVNNSGAKTIRYEGMAIAAEILQEGHIYNFVYTKENNVYYWDILGDLSIDTTIEIVDMMVVT